MTLLLDSGSVTQASNDRTVSSCQYSGGILIILCHVMGGLKVFALHLLCVPLG